MQEARRPLETIGMMDKLDKQQIESDGLKAAAYPRRSMVNINRDSIVLHAAKPTLDEGLTFARYLDEAAEGFFRFMIGRRVERVIATAFLQPNHDLSYQNVTFAEHEGAIVGMVSGYTAKQHRVSSRRPLIEAAGRSNLRMRILWLLFTPLMRIIDSMGDEDFYLQAIAVSKELRGAGVGSVLMDFLEEQAKASGSTRLALDVSGQNAGARGFYTKRGMNIESQWPRRLPIQALKFYRMTKVLRPMLLVPAMTTTRHGSVAASSPCCKRQSMFSRRSQP